MDTPSTSGAVTLFGKEDNGFVHRIPALLYIQQPPTFLAFAEKRSSPRDQDALFIVMRRGVEQNGVLHWENERVVANAKMPGCRTMNPCPVYDEKTKTLFLFFICVRRNVSEMHQILTGRNAARLCCVTSNDLGTNWSLLKELTEEILGEDLRNCATLAVGPGHGIQAPSGRLIVPAYLYYIHCRMCCLPIPFWTKPHSFTIYSDDQGSSWHKGDMLWGQKTVECEMAEVVCRNGSHLLYCSARTGKHFRVEAVSQNQGMAFANSHYCQELCEPPHGCQGSVVCYEPLEEAEELEKTGSEANQSLTGEGTTSWLIYSHPTSSTRRVDLGIYVNKSPLEPNSWTQPWIICRGPSGYSDLAVCQDTHAVGCLYECGLNACEKIDFRRFSIQELMDKVPSA
ncbi:hypothetical protein XENTR_v10007270 [Xenopus tropicalis]|uniref:exo-alpha-sialidase n=1 Tax=Xenopus tropicalis TaxID=8364 RepID=F6TPK8_XENTR|nr:hypothetical protein XENTR_v10007270 [Xenopus tropicalis]